MYVLKAKPKICAPHSSQTDEPRNTKTDMGHLGLNMTPSANYGLDRFTGAGATQPPFHVDFGFFLFSFILFHYCPPFIDQATARTA
jgi:hypothetical protein